MNQVGFQFEEATGWVVQTPYGNYLCDGQEDYSDSVCDAASFPTVKGAERFADSFGLTEYRLCRVAVTKEITTYERCD